MFNGEKVVVLIVGKSGVGKTEFILSFVDEKLRDKIPASGDGQTTRNTIRYNIYFDNNYNDNKIKIKLKTKSNFVESRMMSVEKYIREIGLKAFINNYDECIKNFRKEVIHDAAFFDCLEFGKNIANDIDEKFSEIFSKEFWKKIPQINIEKDDKKFWDELLNIDINAENTENKKFCNVFEEFFADLYDKCKQIYDKDVNNQIIDLNGNTDIQKFLKTERNAISYTSIIECVTIDVKGADFYIQEMNDKGISCLGLIDTYGLDHEVAMNDEVLKNRYTSLFIKEFPNIKTIFYLIDGATSDSPAYLKENIPLIFDVAPSMMPFIIFTKVDNIEKGKDLTDKKVYQTTDLDGDIFNFKLKNIIHNNGLSFNLINKKFNFITKNRIGYCSAKEPKNEYDKEKNKKIIELLEIIKNKTYLGESYIPIDLLKSNVVKGILNIEKLFKDKSIKGITYGRTKWAIKNRFKDGTLGFLGTTGNFLWSNLLSKDLDNRFKNITAVIEYIKSNLPTDCNEESVIGAIEQLFTEFSKQLYNYGQDHVNSLNLKYYSNQIIEKMYFSLKQKIESYVNNDGHESMDDAYAFSRIDNNTKKEIKEIINDAYINWFIQECRKHNAKIKAKEIKENMTYEEKENSIKDYFDKYDKDASYEDKLYFEEQLENA